MIIIQLDGGLGNQMFEYALYFSFEKKRLNVKLDTSIFKENPGHNGYELEKVFKINGAYCSSLEKKIIKPVTKFLHILFKYPYKERYQQQWLYQPKVSDVRFGFLKGYWQSEKYFRNIENELRRKFSFPQVTDANNIEALKQILKTNSVSLHIRRADYLLAGRSCTLIIIIKQLN